LCAHWWANALPNSQALTINAEQDVPLADIEALLAEA